MNTRPSEAKLIHYGVSDAALDIAVALYYSKNPHLVAPR